MKTLERKTLERQTLERHTLEKEILERQTLEKQILERKPLERKTIEKRTIERKILERQTLERQNLETALRTQRLLQKRIFISGSRIANSLDLAPIKNLCWLSSWISLRKSNLHRSKSNLFKEP